MYDLEGRERPESRVNSGEIDPFRKISCGIGIRFFNLYDKESGNTLGTPVDSGLSIDPLILGNVTE